VELVSILLAFAAGISVGFVQGRVFERVAKFKAEKRLFKEDE
jgi:hypothetical protein